MSKIKAGIKMKGELISPLGRKCEDNLNDVETKINGSAPLKVPTYADIVRAGSNNHKQNTQQETNSEKTIKYTH